MVGAVLYGVPALGLIEPSPGAVQVSPLMPGSADLAQIADLSLDSATVLAPPGTLERDFVVAHALRSLKVGGHLSVFAPKEKGGARLRKMLEQFGCQVSENARRHYRFCEVARPAGLHGIVEAITLGTPRIVPSLGLWSQPGVFSWDRLDPGSALLLAHLPTLSGNGADFGAGIGVLGHKLLSDVGLTHLTLVEMDRRAVESAKRNLDDRRVEVIWADVRQLGDQMRDLDFVVMNPPFHDGGAEDRNLGVAFIDAAGSALRKGGVCWLTANRHLPYEAPLRAAFAKVTLVAEQGGYKIYEARK